MKSAVLVGLVLLSGLGGLSRIHDHNAALQRGATAYARQDWDEAAAAYKQAATTLQDQGEAVWLNLAHATLQAGRPAEARGYYSRLSTSSTGTVRSVAFQQLAVIAARKADYAQAAGLCRQALLADPANAAARYNYELLRTMLARPTPPPPPAGSGPGQQPKSSGAKDGSDQSSQRNDNRPDPSSPAEARPAAGGRPNSDQASGQPGTTANNGLRPGNGAERTMAQGNTPGTVRGLSNQPSDPEATGGSRRGGTEAATNAEANLQTQQARLQQMNLSTGQARQLLEALHAAEQQYLQQLPRKATKPVDKGRPGW